jgi:hypothetical protein
MTHATPFRRPDWKLQLIQFMGDAARTPFQPGVHDCALFAAGAIFAMADVDFAADFRGKYSTINGGLKLLQKAGFADHIALAAHLFEDIAPAFAAPGDLAVVPQTSGDALGVVQGAFIYVLTPDRLGLVPLLAASRAFRVAA